MLLYSAMKYPLTYLLTCLLIHLLTDVRTDVLTYLLTSSAAIAAGSCACTACAWCGGRARRGQSAAGVGGAESCRNSIATSTIAMVSIAESCRRMVRRRRSSLITTHNGLLTTHYSMLTTNGSLCNAHVPVAG